MYSHKVVVGKAKKPAAPKKGPASSKKVVVGKAKKATSLEPVLASLATPSAPIDEASSKQAGYTAFASI